MRIEKLLDDNGEEVYGTYVVTSPWFPPYTICLDNDNLINTIKDEFVWEVFKAIDGLKRKLLLASQDNTFMEQQHIKRALNMQKLIDRIKQLEKTITKE